LAAPYETEASIVAESEVPSLCSPTCAASAAITGHAFRSKKMPPPVRTFPPETLPEEVQLDTSGRKRKPAPGAPRNIDLSACELFTMSQYECVVPRPDVPDSRVQCYEVLRLFRK